LPSETNAKIRINFGPPGSLWVSSRNENTRKRGLFVGSTISLSREDALPVFPVMFLAAMLMLRHSRS
jgi:hypothetical protein